MRKIKIEVGSKHFIAELYDTETARIILDNLPFEGAANLWGEEIYFVIPVKIELENESRVAVEVGELGYWPVGSAFCIFFGKTPSSTDDQPRAYSPVNVFGKIIGDSIDLKTVPSGSVVKISLNE